MSAKSVFRRAVGVLAALTLASCSESGFPVADGGFVDPATDERVVFLNYWAVWCAPCIAELPELWEFHNSHRERAVVYAVNFDRPPADELMEDIEALNVRIPALVEDPQEALGYPRPQVLPTTYVLKQGELLHTLVGPQTGETLLQVLEQVEQAQ